MKLRFTLLFSSLGLPLLLVAQNGESQRSCRILFLSPAADAPKTLYLYDGLESIEVDLPRMNLSQTYQLRPGPLTLKLLNEPALDPQMVPPDAPSVEVAEDLTDIYVLVTSDLSHQLAPVRLSIVNADHARFKKGEMLWLNHTDKAIEGFIGSRKLKLEPQASVIVAEPARGRVSYPVEIFYTLADQETVYPLCETVWRHDPRSRNLVIIINDQKRKAPRIISFSDFRG